MRNIFEVTKPKIRSYTETKTSLRFVLGTKKLVPRPVYNY